MQDPTLLHAIASQAINKLSEFKPAELAMTAWASSRLLVCDSPLLDAIASAARARIHDASISGDALGTVLQALACLDDLSLALQLVDTIEDHGLLNNVDAVFLGSLLSALERCGGAALGHELRLVSHLGQGRLRPAAYMYMATKLAASEGQPAEAIGLLQHAFETGSLDSAGFRVWIACGGGRLDGGSSYAGLLAPRASSTASHLQGSEKELKLLTYVLSNAHAGDPRSVCEAVEQYASNYLLPRGLWLKIVGGVKAAALANWMREAPTHGSVLEVGTYIGYSAMRIASALPGVRIITLEAHPVNALIARSLIAFAGLAHVVDVCVGHSGDLLPRLRARYEGPPSLALRAAFFDQRGSRYDTDLQTLEHSGLLLPGALIIADNVLKPGAPLFLWRLLKSSSTGPGPFVAHTVSLPEFGMGEEQVEDWMAVTRYTGPDCSSGGILPPPDLLVQLEWEAEKIRARANCPGAAGVSFQEWAAFGSRMRHGLERVGIMAEFYNV